MKRSQLSLLTFCIMIILLSISAVASPIDGNTHYYKFDGNANDAIGSLHGTANGAVLATGKYNQAYYYDGVNDYIQLPDNIFIGSTSFSFAWWQNSTSSVTNRKVLSFFNDLNTGIYYNDVSPGLCFEVYSGSAWKTACDTTPTNNVWTHYTATYNLSSGSMKFYENCALVGSNTSTLATSATANGNKISDSTNDFGGKFDGLAIWNRTLPASEVSQLCSAGQHPYIFSIVSNTYSGNQLLNYSATITLANGSSFTGSTINGTIMTPWQVTSTTANISITDNQSNAYLNLIYTNQNIGGPFLFNYSVYTPNVKNYITQQSISSFNLTTSSTILLGSNYYMNTGSREVYFNSNQYMQKSLNISLIAGINSQTVYMYPKSKLLVNIYNASSNQLVLSSVQVSFENSNITLSSTTSNGSLTLDLENVGSFDVILTASGFEQARYIIDVVDDSFQLLNAYLVPTQANDVVFNVFKDGTASAIESATFNIETKVNNHYELISSYRTDVSGKIQFSYNPSIRYRFTVSKDGYDEKQFELYPIILSSYNIYLTKAAVEEVPGFTGINVYFGANCDVNMSGLIKYTYCKNYFLNNDTNRFSFQISSPTGNLLSYNYSLQVTNDPVEKTEEGFNSYGSTLESEFDINGSQRFDIVVLRYSYTTTSGVTKTFQNVYQIENDDGTTFTFVDNEDNPFGLPLLDRIIIMLAIVVPVSGAAFMLSGLQGAGLMAGVVMIYFVQIHFISIWAVIVPALLIVMLLGWRS